MRRALLLLAVLAPAALPCAGCKLVDQRSFYRDADRPPVPLAPKPGPPAPAPTALVSFPADSPRSEWDGILRTAADLARSRKPNVLFRVETAVPPGGDPQAQAASLAAALGAARQAADVIVADGVDRSQVELGAATDASVRHPEIRIFVR